MSATNINTAIEAQYELIKTVSSSSPLSTVLTASSIDTISTDVSGIQSNAADFSSDETAILTQQDNTKRILDREYNRLAQKKNSIDTIISGQKRMQQLNTSYNSRYMAYVRVIIVVILLSFAFAVVLRFYNTAPGLNSFLGNIFLLLIFGTGVLYVLYMLYDIWRRDNMDFDKLSQATMVTPNVNKETKYKGDGNGDSLFSMGKFCVGSACCSTGMKFDENQGRCVTEGFTPSRAAGFGGGKSPGMVDPAGGASVESNTYVLQYVPFK